MLPLQAADYLAWQMRRHYANQENLAAARRLTLVPPGQYVIEEGDVPIMTHVINAPLLRRSGDERPAETIATLDKTDLPIHERDQIRRVLTERLRGDPQRPVLEP